MDQGEHAVKAIIGHRIVRRKVKRSQSQAIDPQVDLINDFDYTENQFYRDEEVDVADIEFKVHWEQNDEKSWWPQENLSNAGEALVDYFLKELKKEEKEPDADEKTKWEVELLGAVFLSNKTCIVLECHHKQCYFQCRSCLQREKEHRERPLIAAGGRPINQARYNTHDADIPYYCKACSDEFSSGFSAMHEMKVKSCRYCSSDASHNKQENIHHPLLCSKHAEPGMVNVLPKSCIIVEVNDVFVSTQYAAQHFPRELSQYLSSHIITITDQSLGEDGLEFVLSLEHMPQMPGHMPNRSGHKHHDSLKDIQRDLDSKHRSIQDLEPYSVRGRFIAHRAKYSDDYNAYDDNGLRDTFRAHPVEFTESTVADLKPHLQVCFVRTHMMLELGDYIAECIFESKWDWYMWAITSPQNNPEKLEAVFSDGHNFLSLDIQTISENFVFAALFDSIQWDGHVSTDFLLNIGVLYPELKGDIEKNVLFTCARAISMLAKDAKTLRRQARNIASMTKQILFESNISLVEKIMGCLEYLLNARPLEHISRFATMQLQQNHRIDACNETAGTRQAMQSLTTVQGWVIIKHTHNERVFRAEIGGKIHNVHEVYVNLVTIICDAAAEIYRYFSSTFDTWATIEELRLSSLTDGPHSGDGILSGSMSSGSRGNSGGRGVGGAGQDLILACQINDVRVARPERGKGSLENEKAQLKERLNASKGSRQSQRVRNAREGTSHEGELYSISKSNTSIIKGISPLYVHYHFFMYGGLCLPSSLERDNERMQDIRMFLEMLCNPDECTISALHRSKILNEQMVKVNILEFNCTLDVPIGWVTDPKKEDAALRGWQEELSELHMQIARARKNADSEGSLDRMLQRREELKLKLSQKRQKQSMSMGVPFSQQLTARSQKKAQTHLTRAMQILQNNYYNF